MEISSLRSTTTTTIIIITTTTGYAALCRTSSWGLTATVTTIIITTTITTITTDRLRSLKACPSHDEKQDLRILFFCAAYSWRAFSFAAR